MKKKLVSLLSFLILSLFILSFSAVAEKSNTSSPSLEEINIHEAGSGLRSYTEFKGKLLGAVSGSICGGVGEDIGATPIYYSVEEAIIADVRKGKLHGFVHDWSVLKVLVGLPGNEDLECVEIPAEIFSAPMGAMSAKQDIITRFDAFLAKTKESGILYEMQGRWLDRVPDKDAPMPDITLSPTNGTLKVAVTPTAFPFVYKGENGEYKGYSAELAIRFAEYEGMEIDFIDMDFSGLIPYVISDKADFAIANVSITKERQKIVLFSESIYNDRQGVLALKTDSAGRKPFSITNARKNSGLPGWFDSNLLENKIFHGQGNVLLAGLLITLMIGVGAEVLGVILGYLISKLLYSKINPLALAGRIYCHLMNGIPIVVVILFTYYIVLPKIGLVGTLIGIIFFALEEAAAIAPFFQINAITCGDKDIENLCGERSFKNKLFKFKKLLLVPLSNRFSVLIKKTSIVGFIAIYDLLSDGNIVWSDNHVAHISFIQILLLYFIIITLLILTMNYISSKINKI